MLSEKAFCKRKTMNYFTYQLVDKAYQTMKIIFDGKCKSALPFIFDWSPGQDSYYAHVTDKKTMLTP